MSTTNDAISWPQRIGYLAKKARRLYVSEIYAEHALSALRASLATDGRVQIPGGTERARPLMVELITLPCFIPYGPAPAQPGDKIIYVNATCSGEVEPEEWGYASFSGYTRAYKICERGETDQKCTETFQPVG